MKLFYKKEFIGLYCEVLKSTNKNLEGIFGVIIDETKNTFKIKTEDGSVKILPKKDCIFLFYYNNFLIKIPGKLINKRPWERLKIKLIKKI